jgi:hypothetical protein
VLALLAKPHVIRTHPAEGSVLACTTRRRNELGPDGLDSLSRVSAGTKRDESRIAAADDSGPMREHVR